MSETEIFTTGDIRLTRLLSRPTLKCATVNEYALASGISVSKVLELIGEHLEKGTLDIEAVGGEIFVHTAPNGRPGPSMLPQPAANMWEILRGRYPADKAFAVWKLARELEAAGWATEVNPNHIPANKDSAVPPIGIKIHSSVLPVLVRTPLDKLGQGHGPLTSYENRGLGGVVVTCANGKLDQCVTTIRAWLLERYQRSRLHVLVLEEPTYTPVLLGPDDSSITPRSVSIEDLDTYSEALKEEKH